MLQPLAHVLPEAKLDFSHTESLRLYLLPYMENFRIFHTRGHHAGRRVNRVIVGHDKVWENVDIYEGILIRKYLCSQEAIRAMRNFYDCTFHVCMFLIC